MPSFTLEEMEKMKQYEEKLEKKRAYQRQWMANKRKNDPEFYAKQKAYNAQRKKEKYANDEEYRKKELEYTKKYLATQRAADKILGQGLSALKKISGEQYGTYTEWGWKSRCQVCNEFYSFFKRTNTGCQCAEPLIIDDFVN